MRDQEIQIQQAQEVLRTLQNIQSGPSAKLLAVRDVIPRTEKFNTIVGCSFLHAEHAHLIVSIAVTLCNVGRCGELSNRFIVEYSQKYPANIEKIALIWMCKKNHFEKNHLIVCIGSITQTEDDLFRTGKKVVNNCFAGLDADDVSHGIDLNIFFQKNPSCIFVDALLNFVGTSDQLSQVKLYCSQNEITHVCGIHTYDIPNGFCPVMKEIAESLAKETLGLVPKTMCCNATELLGKQYEISSVQKHSLFYSGTLGVHGCDPPPESVIRNGITYIHPNS